ncbi:Cysteine dioxygenase type 1 [Mizuhopecten yessoensis]|uniref:Cysteine dioxygenase n=1 Tax=Mizuhopecten yessoensis TaxID=6573 RepID=A0A210QCT1_MIZYE|nr:Cysteine dioxygenase type 1 [Mizuhopecten yessoensis]
MAVGTNEQKQQLRYCDTTQIDAPRTLEDLINELYKVFEYDEVNVEYVKKLMTSYESNRTDWKKFAKFDSHRAKEWNQSTGQVVKNCIALCPL